MAHFTCTFWLPQLSNQTKNMIIVVSNWNWIIDSCHKLIHIQPWYEVLGEVPLDLIIYFCLSKCLHWNGQNFETIKVLSGNWNTLILRVSNPPNPLFGLNIWHQYFMDLNENFSRSCHDWTWFVFPNYILNGWKSFWQFMWQPLKSFLLLKKHLYFLWLYEFTSYMSHWDFFLTIPSMFSSLKPQSMVPNWKTCQENMFSKFGIFSWPYQTCFHPSNLSLIMFKWK